MHNWDESGFSADEVIRAHDEECHASWKPATGSIHFNPQNPHLVANGFGIHPPHRTMSESQDCQSFTPAERLPEIINVLVSGDGASVPRELLQPGKEVVPGYS